MKVGFVLQPDEDVEDILRWACRQINKVYQAGVRIWVKGDDGDLATINSLLWTFQQTSFIPHLHLFEGAVIPEAHQGTTPIILSQSLPQSFEPEMIINLSREICPTIAGVDEIIELVSNLPELKEIGRNKFKSYRKLGLDPKMQS